MKNDIVNAFEKITPARSNDEVLSYVLRRSNDMENITKKKKISFRKPVTAIIAAAVTATLCVTGAAAAGLFSFDDIFGNRIKAENAELGEALMCSADNFTYTVSDDDYKIELNGISGSSQEIIANIEISRVDGTPATDYFVNEYNPDDGIYSHEDNLVAYKPNYNERHMGGTGKYKINDEGNIEIVYVIGRTNIDSPPLSGEKIILHGAKIYPTDAYFDFLCEDNNAVAWFEKGELIYYKNCTDNIIEIDTSPVHYLDLFWSAEFTYVPSNEALKTISRSYFGEEDRLPCKAHLYDENHNRTDLDCTVKFIDMKLTSTCATVSFNMEYKELENGDIPFPDIEKAYLVRKDGSKILMIMDSGEGANYAEYTFTYKYCSRYEELESGGAFIDHIAVDLTDAVGIEINGKLYEF
ncbi:MAG: hypothetical protein J6A41_05985 [Ruminiclostridium sp.]|nr:hypothetical protein [Ruminiclostridium sp.]